MKQARRWACRIEDGMKQRRTDGKICANCNAFGYEQGPVGGEASQKQGLCRASSAGVTGNKWAFVRGDDWCRDDFEPVGADVPADS